MTRDKKPRGFDARLARLQVMRSQPPTSETTRELRQHLADASSFIVAEAARIIKDQGLSELVPDLAAAFERLMTDPEESDKQCRAKIEIVEALNALEYSEPDVFLRGLTHHQDCRYGEPPGQDAAGALRAHCAFALTRIDHPGVILMLTDLLLDTDDAARVGAARALGAGSAAAVPLLRYKVRIGDRLVDVIGECFTSLLTLAFEESLPFVAPYLRAHSSALQGAAMFALAETRKAEAFVILRDYWPKAPADLRESLPIALAMLRLPAANDFLIGLIAGGHPAARAVLSALAIHRDNPKIASSIAAAVRANGTVAVRDWFKRKFPAAPEATGE